MSTRDAYGHVLETEIYKNPDVVVVDADIASSTRAEKFKNKAPERFFNVGISEQDLMGTAAGLAAVGKIPLAGSYALFTERGLEITRNSICLPNLNVKIIVSHGGLTIGSDGATHQAIEDIALMRSLPNLSVIVPSDAWETEEAVKAAVAHKGPVYIRLGNVAVPDIHPAGSTFQWGKGQILRDGIDVALIGTGRMTAAALAAADQLRQDGLEAMVQHADHQAHRCRSHRICGPQNRTHRHGRRRYRSRRPRFCRSRNARAPLSGPSGIHRRAGYIR